MIRNFEEETRDRTFMESLGTIIEYFEKEKDAYEDLYRKVKLENCTIGEYIDQYRISVAFSREEDKKKVAGRFYKNLPASLQKEVETSLSKNLAEEYVPDKLEDVIEMLLLCRNSDFYVRGAKKMLRGEYNCEACGINKTHIHREMF